LFVEEHDAQPVGLDLCEVPDHSDEAHRGWWEGATGELLGVQACEFQQGGDSRTTARHFGGPSTTAGRPHLSRSKLPDAVPEADRHEDKIADGG
jgi:hypothetical protein